MATLVPMTDGLVMLAHQATKGLSIRTRVVYAQDDWEYEEGLSPIMRHKPNPAADHSDGMVIATGMRLRGGRAALTPISR